MVEVCPIQCLLCGLSQGLGFHPTPCSFGAFGTQCRVTNHTVVEFGYFLILFASSSSLRGSPLEHDQSYHSRNKKLEGLHIIPGLVPLANHLAPTLSWPSVVFSVLIRTQTHITGPSGLIILFESTFT